MIRLTAGLRFPVYLLLVFLSLSFLSFQWPVAKGRITSTFGETRWDHFHDGIDMVCNDNLVYPVKEGELLFFWDRSIFPVENFPGGGNYIILKHDKNLYSLYMHLKEIYAGETEYKENHVLGLIGNTGHSFAAHLHFSILDLNERKSFNPYLLLPKRIDERSPEITELALKIEDKYFRIKNDSNFRLTKHYPLLIKIKDSITGRERLGVYSLKVELNSRIVLDVSYDAIEYSESGLTIGGNLFSSIMEEGGYYAASEIKYLNGLNNLKIKTKDYSGNIANKEYRFNVELDLE